MTSAELLVDAFGRIRESVHAVLNGLGDEELAHRPDGHANSVAWLVWHLTRVQDDHVADVAGVKQRWTADGWSERFDLPLEAADTGYGHTADQVATVVASADALRGYYDAVHAQTLAFVARLTDSELDRVVDVRWDPPVTLGVRLVSVLDDDLEHVGQAAFLRGLLRSP